MRGVVAVLIVLTPLATRADDKKPRYEYRENHDPNGIGKFYMGREIAHVMGYQAAGWSTGWFVELATTRAARYGGHGRPVFNGAGFRTSFARSVRFDERRRKASDSVWMRALLRHRRAWRTLPEESAAVNQTESPW